MFFFPSELLLEVLTVMPCVPPDRSLLKNSQGRHSLAGIPSQVSAVRQTSFEPPDGEPSLGGHSFSASHPQSGLLDANTLCYNPAAIGSIPLHSLPHILQEQMNGALANGSGYQSDSSTTQSPPQAL